MAQVIGKVTKSSIFKTLYWEGDSFFLLKTNQFIVISNEKLNNKDAENWAKIHLGAAVANHVKNSKRYKMEKIAC